jgi:hypothetical protein
VKPLQRRVLLIIALAATLAATWWVSTQDEVETSRETQRETRRKPVAAAVATRDARPAPNATPEPATDLPLENLQRAPHGNHISNLFPGKNWQALPPKLNAKEAAKQAAQQAALQAPPPPVAPPLPFSAFGQMEEGGRTVIFLNGKDRSYAAAVGDVVEKNYRVDTIKDGMVVLTYLPLNLQQTLRTGTN